MKGSCSRLRETISRSFRDNHHRRSTASGYGGCPSTILFPRSEQPARKPMSQSGRGTAGSVSKGGVSLRPSLRRESRSRKPRLRLDVSAKWILFPPFGCWLLWRSACFLAWGAFFCAKILCGCVRKKNESRPDPDPTEKQLSGKKRDED